MSLIRREYADTDTSMGAAEWRRKRDLGTLGNQYADFPVGSRVKVIARFQDFFFFPGDQLGRVVSNSGRYLGIHVAFDEPMHFTDGTVKSSHGFLPEDLMLACPRCGQTDHGCPTEPTPGGTR